MYYTSGEPTIEKISNKIIQLLGLLERNFGPLSILLVDIVIGFNDGFVFVSFPHGYFALNLILLWPRKIDS